MAGQERPTPNVYMFREDQDLIKDFVSRSRPCYGDLFGLWTDADNEPVVHLVTGQLETENGMSEEPSKRVQDIRKTLRDRFMLPRIGKWVFERDSKQTRNEIADAMRVEKGLFVSVKTSPKFVLLIIVSYDKSTNKMLLSPYFVSKATVSTKGTIEFLHEENVFLKVEEIRELTGSSAKHIAGRKESESDPELSQSEKAYKDSPSDPKVRELPPPPANGANRLGAAQIKPGVGTSGTESAYNGRVRHIPGGQTDELRVFIFEKDVKMMEELVLQYPDVETGGDLFGLWTTEGGAVVHIVLGPGKNCRRTDVSFNQDIPYLQKQGELLTQKYMLCHIGEWHSHHQLRLFQPSRGDSSTVIRNYPRGVRGFVLIIANIVAPGRVKLTPYLYTQESRYTYDVMGEVIPLGVPNAFRGIPEIKDTIKRGKETKDDVQRNLALLQQRYSTSVSKGHHRRNHSPTRNNPVLNANRNNPKGHDITEEPMDVDPPNYRHKNKQSTGRR